MSKTSEIKVFSDEWYAQMIQRFFPNATDAQVTAIHNQMAAYSEDWCPAFGLCDIDDTYSDMATKDQVAVAFNYFADKKAETIGVEVTIFAADGSVVSSQDFG